MIVAVVEGVPSLPISAACSALRVPRATYYRSKKPRPQRAPREQYRALSGPEQRAVVDVLHEPRFVDLAPAQIYAMLLDEGRYLCSERTMYRILAAHCEVRERRNQLRHPAYAKPHVVAKRPNELWSWDITKLLGPCKWSYFYLYVVMDIFSRYVVGWMVAHRELASLAQRLLSDCCRRQNVQADRLTIYADRGTSMMSKPVALLLADLGVTKSHSRPKTSNDNPFSEAHFKTLKYRPDFPSRFGSIEHARAHCVDFFAWYNEQHHHAGIGLLTPSDVHHGLAGERLAHRALALRAAFQRNPERFSNGSPLPPQPPTEVWINKPASYSNRRFWLSHWRWQVPPGVTASSSEYTRHARLEPMVDPPRDLAYRRARRCYVWASSETVMAKPRALITGISGQDGFYLAQLLLRRGTEVLGMARSDAAVPGAITQRADITDTAAIRAIIEKFAPDQCYHLAAHHRSSAATPTLSPREEESQSVEVNLRATLGLLQTLRDLRPSCRVFLAGSCHMFGAVASAVQSEATPFAPNAPYGISKVAAWHFAKVYRERSWLFCSMGILYNHESPRRGPAFVTARIAQAAAEIAMGKRSELTLGSLSGKVDWGFAGDYVDAMWRTLQNDSPEDFIIASGEIHSIQEFVELAFGHVSLDWRKYVREEAGLHNPVHSGVYQGDIGKIRAKLGWQPTTSLREIAAMMVDHYLRR